MKPRDWGLMALRREPMPFAPDGRQCRPPMFELSMEITDELFDRRWIRLEHLEAVSGEERRSMLHHKAETYFITAERLGSPFIRTRYFPTLEDELETIRHLQRLGAGDYILCAEADDTFRIPDGDEYLTFVYGMSDHPEDVLAEGERRCQATIDRGKHLVDAGVEVITMCADYCFNTGPFLSPRQWDRFIGQFYNRQVRELKEYGAKVVKHTDGNLMLLLSRLVDAGADALQSIDPMAGVDIAQVKRLVGDKICLIGNVHLGKLQSGTRDEIRESAEYCMRYGGKGGGYIYGSCNSIFPGVPAENYLYMLDLWRESGPSPLEI